jgi:hypothetical protein
MRSRTTVSFGTIVATLFLSSQMALAQFTQQGPPLFPPSNMGPLVQQGYSVALSTDGNTAIVGGPANGGSAGAAFVYTRSGGVWTQQGGELIGTGAVGGARQGTSVALSGDGNTAIVGGPNDNGSIGAAWVFTRTDGIWTQQGSKLLANDAVANGQGLIGQGYSVSLSADGNTAIVGGIYDTPSGAAYVYTRSSGVWTQQGSKLV